MCILTWHGVENVKQDVFCILIHYFSHTSEATFALLAILGPHWPLALHSLISEYQQT